MKNSLKSTIISAAGILMVCIFLISTKTQIYAKTNISEEEMEQQKDAPYLSEEYRNYYIKENELDIPNFSESTKVKKYLKNCEKGSFVNIQEMGFFTSHYETTENDSEYVYYGDLKNDKPDGLGVIKKKILLNMKKDGTIEGIYPISGYNWVENPVLGYATVYAGYMENGRKNGYGMLFSLPDSDDDDGLGKELMALSEVLYQNVEDDIQKSIEVSVNPLIYEGEFKKDKYNGKGIEYYYATLEFAVVPEYETGTAEYEITEEFGQALNKIKNGKVIGVTAGQWKKGELIEGEMQTEKTENIGKTKNKVSIQEKNKSADIYEKDYIFPESSSRYLTNDEIKSVNNNLRQMAINEIYARHGRKFNTPEIQEYFNAKNWYKGSVEPGEFNDTVLNEYEKVNIKTIADCMGNVAVEHPLEDYQ